MKENTTLGEVGHTGAGFEIVQFKDYYSHTCSLQMSSICLGCAPGESAVWLGPEDAEPKVLHSDAAKLGIKTNAKCGWVPYPIPDEVSLYTRMHLNRDQVEALITHLQAWLDNGSFEPQPPPTFS